VEHIIAVSTLVSQCKGSRVSKTSKFRSLLIKLTPDHGVSYESCNASV